MHYQLGAPAESCSAAGSQVKEEPQCSSSTAARPNLGRAARALPHLPKHKQAVHHLGTAANAVQQERLLKQMCSTHDARHVKKQHQRLPQNLTQLSA
jgi:hypothetical protein